MADEFAYAGVHHTPTTALRIVGRGNGILSAIVDGVTYTGPTLSTSVRDGIGIVDIEGLFPDKSYTVQVYVGSTLVQTIQTKTWPERGPFKFAFGSCVIGDVINAGYLQAAKKGALFFATQGDWPYVDTGTATPWTANWTVLKGHQNALSREAYWTTHRREALNPAVVAGNALLQRVMQPDDHEWPGDNWDHTPTQAESQNACSDTIGVTNPPTQAEVDAIHYAAAQAMGDYYQGNPDCSDSERVAEKPAQCAAGTATSQYQPLYTRFGNDLVEFFLIDCITHRTVIDGGGGSTVQYAGKSMLGTAQKAWLKAKLLASTATFKIILTGKMTYRPGGSNNADTWYHYSAERDEILTYIDSNDITGVFWAAGDRHTPQVYGKVKTAQTITSNGTSIGLVGTYDHLCVVACPIGVQLNDTLSNIGNDVVWINSIITSDLHQVYGLVEVTENYLDISIQGIRSSEGVGSDSGKIWGCRLYAGTNYGVAPRPLVTA